LTPQSPHARIYSLDFIDVGTVAPAPIGVKTPRRNTLVVVRRPNLSFGLQY
jgi:hypothetical protein